MTERPDDTRLHDWLDETVGQTPDPVEGTRQVMSQVEETSQVGRWLPFPVLHRKAKAKTPTTNHTTEYQPSPIPATNGHTPTVIGRTQIHVQSSQGHHRRCTRLRHRRRCSSSPSRSASRAAFRVPSKERNSHPR